VRLVTFVPPDGDARAGVLLGSAVVDLAAAAPLVLAEAEGLRWDMLSLLQGDQEGVTLDDAADMSAAVLDALGSTTESALAPLADNGSQNTGPTGNISLGGVEMLLPLQQVRLLAPLPRPASLRLFAVLAERRTPFPAFVFGNHAAIVGPDELIVPPPSDDLCYGLGVACVLGRAGRDIAVDDAAAYIAGYTIMNDWYARDIAAYAATLGLSTARAHDFATTLGPWLVTPDELEIYADDDGGFMLSLVARVNGVERSRDSLIRSQYTFAEMIAYASQSTTLFPGDVLFSGAAASADAQVVRGDTVELEVTGLGLLRNQLG
jgi:fumarylacetoacetate (FAA) hydrolase